MVMAIDENRLFLTGARTVERVGKGKWASERVFDPSGDQNAQFSLNNLPAPIGFFPE
jgi:hypothetical protein